MIVIIKYGMFYMLRMRFVCSVLSVSIICWYLDKADGIKDSSIGSNPIAAEVSGLDEKTAISANLTNKTEMKKKF